MQMLGINDIPVVGNGDSVVTLADDKGLYITDLARTTGGIAIMADGNVTDEATKGLFIKYVRDKPHVTGYLYPSAVGNGNTGTFLTTVL
jgi:hypothetical protein